MVPVRHLIQNINQFMMKKKFERSCPLVRYCADPGRQPPLGDSCGSELECRRASAVVSFEVPLRIFSVVHLPLSSESGSF